jgi:hypothetical protein
MAKTPRTGTSKTAAGRKISLKKIVKDIDRALKALEPAVEARAAAPSVNVQRARLSLRAARDAVESACVPGFEIPSD